jgi:hypothetical protein
MRNLRVGVLTFHRCINYGSFWQAKCLTEGLRSLGYDAVILDHDSRRINLAEWRCAYQPLLPTKIPAQSFPVYRRKISRFFRAFESLPLSSRFDIEHPQEMESCDIVVIGSDEVWNLFHPWYGKCPIFYGKGVRTKKLVSYAASFGNYPSSMGLHPFFKERLHDFEHISVRDRNSQALIESTLGFVPQLVLDPCLHFDVPASNNISPAAPSEPYVAVYGHSFTEEFARKIKQWAAVKKMPLISIGYHNKWADREWIDADPYDFAHFISHAEAVATNFFHGCVFALKTKKPFVCESSSYRNTKITALLSGLGADDRLLSEDTTTKELHELLSRPPGSNVAAKIRSMKECSGAFLENALQEKSVA